MITKEEWTDPFRKKKKGKKKTASRHCQSKTSRRPGRVRKGEGDLFRGWKGERKER